MRISEPGFEDSNKLATLSLEAEKSDIISKIGNKLDESAGPLIWGCN